MDLASRVLPVCVTLVCLLGGARSSNADELSCPCPEIPLRNLTKSPQQSCFQTDNHFRYKCIEGYVRKAGTSDRTTCKRINGVTQWTKPSLQCIPDPKRTTTEPELPSNTIKNIPLDPIITTTVTAAPTSLQTTQSISTSASVIAKTQRTEPTSHGRQILPDPSHDLLMGSTARDWTTSGPTTTQPSSNSSQEHRGLNSTSTAVITVVSVMIICASSGIAYLCYKRRMSNIARQPTAEEHVPMNDAPTAHSEFVPCGLQQKEAATFQLEGSCR